MATLVTASLGQGPRAAASPWQDARMTAVARLEVGQRIRVEARAAERFTGTFQRSSEGVLLMNSDGGERSLPIADMTGLWVRRSSWGTGAVVGALVVGAGGAVLGAMGLCELGEGSSSSRGECAVGFGALGAFAGALVGGAIGAAIPRWQRRYP